MGVSRDSTFALDPRRDDHSYFLGLLATDGSIYETTRNRGRISFELAASDASVLSNLAERIPYVGHIRRRRRTTNFRANYESVILTFHDMRLRRGLSRLGFQAGKKSLTVTVPREPYHEVGFWRGVIDGDGSLGLTGTDRPFVSLVTASQALRDEYVEFAFRITGSRANPNRNRRDNVYNIVLFDEAAQSLAATLYRAREIAMVRKVRAAELIAAWRRPAARRKVTFERRRWLPEEDRFVLGGLSIDVIAAHLRRTAKSVNIRRWRLRNAAHGAAINVQQ